MVEQTGIRTVDQSVALASNEQRESLHLRCFLSFSLHLKRSWKPLISCQISDICQRGRRKFSVASGVDFKLLTNRARTELLSRDP
jgi:hypothetical protein